MFWRTCRTIGQVDVPAPEYCHMEILFDLDTEAREICDELKLEMVRAKTVGSHPDFVAMIGDLIREKTEGVQPKVLGNLGVRLESCPANCCPSGRPSV